MHRSEFSSVMLAVQGVTTMKYYFVGYEELRLLECYAVWIL
jgi:hypothetical protein